MGQRDGQENVLGRKRSTGLPALLCSDGADKLGKVVCSEGRGGGVISFLLVGRELENDEKCARLDVDVT